MPRIQPRLSMALLATSLAAASCSVSTPKSLTERLKTMANRAPLVVAHRGDSGTNPENTLPAFESAVATGAAMVELDFMQTKDGVLVCFHDEFLDRTTDCRQVFGVGRTRIADHTFADLRRLDAGTFKAARFRGTRIPTLESALLSIQRGSITMIEHKHGDAEKLVSLLRRMDLVEDVLVQSFDWHFLAEVRRMEPGITLGVLGGSDSRPRPILAEIAPIGARLVHWRASRLDPADVQALHAAGYLVCVYTLNSKEQFDQAIALGVDAITTNFPGLMREHLRN